MDEKEMVIKIFANGEVAKKIKACLDEIWIEDWSANKVVSLAHLINKADGIVLEEVVEDGAQE